MEQGDVFAGAGLCVDKVGQATNPETHGIPSLSSVHEVSESQDYL